MSNPASECSISLKFGTDFDLVWAHALQKFTMVKDQGHSAM